MTIIPSLDDMFTELADLGWTVELHRWYGNAWSAFMCQGSPFDQHRPHWRENGRSPRKAVERALHWARGHAALEAQVGHD